MKSKQAQVKSWRQQPPAELASETQRMLATIPKPPVERPYAGRDGRGSVR